MKMPCVHCKDGWNEEADEKCVWCDGSGQVPISKGYVEWVLTHWEAVRWACFEALPIYCKAVDQHPDHLDTIEEIDEDEVVFTGEYNHCSSCGTEYFRLKMPMQFVFDEAYREQVRQEHQRKKANEKAWAEQRKAQELANREALERELLAQLKEKYG
jgi:hypothetical protein